MSDAGLAERALAWARRRRSRVAGHNPWELAVRLWRESVEDRLTGLAAEMAFFALLSLVPLLVAVGAALGPLGRLVNAEDLLRGRALVLDAVGSVMTDDVVTDVVAPIVDSVLFRQGGGLALSSFVVALWLSGRVFTAAIRALDIAYDIEERRSFVQQRLLGVGFALVAVVAVAVTLLVLVVGPLLGGGRELSTRLGLGDAFAVTWSLLRWPVLVVIVLAALTLVYRYGPNVRHDWRQCVPGAVLGFALWLLVTAGFRLYLDAGGGGGGADELEGSEAAAALGRVLGGVVVAILWVYLSALALLVGGELNAELAADRGQPPPRR